MINSEYDSEDEEFETSASKSGAVLFDAEQQQSLMRLTNKKPQHRRSAKLNAENNRQPATIVRSMTTKTQPQYRPNLVTHSRPYQTQNAVAYNHLGTPPGDPTSSDDQTFFAGDDHESIHCPANMNPIYIAIVMALAFVVGVVAEYIPEDDRVQYGLWVDMVGNLYMQTLNCIVVPMAFCQVVISVAEVTRTRSMWTIYLKAAKVFLIICFLSVFLSMQLGIMSANFYEQDNINHKRLQHPPVSFGCGNNRLIHMDTDKMLSCSANVSDIESTTFPYLADPTMVLGQEEPVGNVDVHEYLFAVFDLYFPRNILWSFGKDMYLSVLVVAVFLGMGITKKFYDLPPCDNPLLNLLTHMYTTLFTMLEWVQGLALLAIFPLLIGPMMTDPEATNTLQHAKFYCLTFIFCSILQVFVIVPLVFFCYVRKNPFRWIIRVLPPVFYAWDLQSPFLPLSIATKSVLQTMEVQPALFGSLYPILAALNRGSSAIGLPAALVWSSKTAGCLVEARPIDYLLMLFMSLAACFGDTALPRSRLSLFLTLWRSVCVNFDTPASILAITGVQFITFRLTAFCDTITNLMIVRIIAHTQEKERQESNISQTSARHFYRG